MRRIQRYINRGMDWLEDVQSRAKVEEVPQVSVPQPSAETIANLESLVNAGLQAYINKDYEEARRRFSVALAYCETVPDVAGMSFIHRHLGYIEFYFDDNRKARVHAEQSWKLLESYDAPAIAETRCYSLNFLAAVCHSQGEQETAHQYLRECLRFAREMNEKSVLASALGNYAWISFVAGDENAFEGAILESLRLSQEQGLEHEIAMCLSRRGDADMARHRFASARSHWKDSLTLFRSMNSRKDVACIVDNLGRLARFERDYQEAVSLHRLSLTMKQELGEKVSVAHSLESVAAVAVVLGQGERAARLYGAAATIREEADAPVTGLDVADYETNVAAASALIGADAFVTLCAAGRTIGRDEAIAYALQNDAT